jgi:6-phosphogluconolactonase
MANRQDGPHAHCNVFHPSYRWVFVPDLGDNCIYQYGYKDGRLTPQAHVPLGPGDGPRHFVFHPKLPVAFSGCELGSRLQVRRGWCCCAQLGSSWLQYASLSA